MNEQWSGSGAARAPGIGLQLVWHLRYQVLLLIRTPRALFAGLLLPAMLLVIRGAGHGSSADTALVAGLIALGVVSTAYLTHATGLVTARETGVLRRWRTTPLPRWCFFLARITATVALAVASAALMTAAAAMFYGVRLPGIAVISLLVTVVVGAVCWAAVGTAVAAFIPTQESAQPLLSLTFYPIILLSGVFGPVTDQPQWLSTIVENLPAYPVIDAASRALQSAHNGAVPMAAKDFAVLAAWTAIALAIAVYR